jgi:undecaprenol kinase
MKRPMDMIGFREALYGLIYTFKTQANFKIHLILGVGVFFAAAYFQVTVTEWLFLVVAIFLVLVAELTNTALEATVDLTVSDLNPIAKIVKDTAAAAVLVASFFAIVVGLIIFIPYFQTLG